MHRYRPMMDAMRQLTLLGQLGLSLLMPLLLCLALCWWLTNSLGLGVWVYLPGFVLGLGGGWATAIKFYGMVLRQQKYRAAHPEQDRRPPSPGSSNGHI